MPPRSIRGRLMSACMPALAASAALVDGMPAEAQCVQTGSTITCTGTDTAGNVGAFQSNLTITVQAGATIAPTVASHDGVRIQDASAIVNNGLISAAPSGDGIVLRGDGNTTTKAGLIESTGNGSAVRFDGQADGNVLYNLGTIRNTTTANPSTTLFLFEGTANTLVNAGSIASATQGDAVRLEAGGGTALDLRVVNTGTISNAGGGRAFYVNEGSGASITNGGLIVSNGLGLATIQIGGSGGGTQFSNAAGGTVRNDAIGGRALFITDTGTGQTLTNDGTVTGGLRVDGSGNRFTNNGTLNLRVTASGAFDPVSAEHAAVIHLGGTTVIRPVVGRQLYAHTTIYPSMFQRLTGGTIGGLPGALPTTSAFFTASVLPHGGGSADFDVVLTRIPFNELPVPSPNHLSIIDAIEAAYRNAIANPPPPPPPPGGGPSTLTEAVAALQTLDAPGAVSALNALGGEIATASPTVAFRMGDVLLGAFRDRARHWRPASASAPAMSQLAAAVPLASVARLEADRSRLRRHAIWGSGFSEDGHVDGEIAQGSGRLDYTLGGAAFGIDMRLSERWIVSVGVAATGSDFRIDSLASTGTSQMLEVGAHAAWNAGDTFAEASAVYGYATFSTRRTVSYPGILDTAEAAFDGHLFGGAIAAGYRFRLASIELGPAAGVSAFGFRRGAYAEIAQAGTALAFDAQTRGSVRTRLGFEATATWRLDDRVTVVPRLRAAWIHEFLDDRTVDARFVADPAAAFAWEGARPPRDSAVIGAGVELRIGAAALFADYVGAFASRARAQAAIAGLRLLW